MSKIIIEQNTDNEEEVDYDYTNEEIIEEQEYDCGDEDEDDRYCD